MHEQMLGHGALVLAGKARALEVDAKKRGAVVRAALDDFAGLLHAPQRLLGRVGEHRAEPAGDALARKEAADGAQSLLVGGVHVDVGGAVRMDVDKAGEHGHAGGIELGKTLDVGGVAGETGDLAVFDDNIRARHALRKKDGGAFEVERVLR